MAAGDIETYGPYPLSTAGASLEADSSGSIVSNADAVTATAVGDSIFYTVVKQA